MSGAAKNQLNVINAKEERKLRKPLIERKRRERINFCLEQLKETVIRAFQLDQSKLEKADILEMTVRHLENIQRNRNAGDSLQGVDAQQRFSTGYIQCMHELHTLLLSCDWMEPALGARLLNHLLKCLPKTMDGSTQSPSQNEGSPGRRSSAGLQTKHDTVQTSALTIGDEVTQTHCAFVGSLHMWRPWEKMHHSFDNLTPTTKAQSTRGVSSTPVKANDIDPTADYVSSQLHSLIPPKQLSNPPTNKTPSLDIRSVFLLHFFSVHSTGGSYREI
ncbi:enhancer of split m7 protein-like [Bombina bombina]|uniref:enhancer of split m7 protein-like n=1 Tax=Bombina bombina TaxID=8345 RepID=UPI00235A7FA7|nr:enhancer of split m7 protein-like [Bombina bombina]